MTDESIAIPGYRVEGMLGRGGMGVVYRAYQERLDRWVGLKVISPEIAQDAGFRERFQRESRLAAAIEHPNVLPVYDSGEADGVLYIAMRLIDGVDLGEAIVRDGALDPARAARIVAGVGDALDAAHAKGLVHRDVKPGNVLLARPGQASEHAYLSDFGLSKLVTSDTFAPGSGSDALVGTANYMAPEQCRGERVDGRADVYALGCVLFQALTGSVPFPRDSMIATVWAHVADPPPAPTAMRRDLPGALDPVISRALAKAPEDRFPSAGDLGRAAGAAVAGLPLPGAERTVARGEAAPPRPGDAPTVVPGPGPGPIPVPGAGPGSPPTGPTAPLPAAVPPETRRRRRLGPVLAVIAALVLVAGGAAAAIALSGGGSDGGGTTTAGTSRRAAAPAPSTTASPPASTSTPTPASQPVDVAGAQNEVARVLRTYGRAYDDEDLATLGALLTSTVRRQGAGTPDCLQFGRDQVLEAYRQQFDQGDVAYSLDVSPSDVKVNGDRASVTAIYTADANSDDIAFKLQRVGDQWKIDFIDAVQRSCP